MRTVKIAIRHSRPIPGEYRYIVPEALAAKPLFGKRVLVDFGGRRMEAYVIAETEQEELEQLKPVLQVLDGQAVFDAELLALAEWMSVYWSCSLAVALRLMLPPLLKKARRDSYLAGVGREERSRRRAELSPAAAELLEYLWRHDEISAEAAADYVELAELNALLKAGWLISAGAYRARPRLDQGLLGRLAAAPGADEMAALRRRAPRQAELAEALLHGPLAATELRRRFAAGTINALAAKGYLVWEPAAGAAPHALFHQLSAEQQQALDTISPALAASQYAELLLAGVTGSGKSEVYIRSARQVLSAGQGVIVLLPEIALTRQITAVFERHLGEAAVLHSAMTASERNHAWERIRGGELRLVIGARSAIFAPVQHLKLIIVDEEQENSYKQEERPRYHAREVARQRARMNDAVLLLGSATPSLESAYRAFSGGSRLLLMENRVSDQALPAIEIDDLKQYRGMGMKSIYPRLQQALQLNLALERQSILFINRRGFAPQLLCRACGAVWQCPSCSVAMNYHRDLEALLCHYCGHSQPLAEQCAVCGSNHLQLLGSGTQKLEDEVAGLFPEARVARLDLDSSRRKGEQERILKAMRRGETDILIGTQMVAKGLDFPGVALVGIVDADSMLNLPDYRAGERCYQLMVQVAGRAGRGDHPGQVIIQTWQPRHPVLALAREQNYFAFYAREIQLRHQLYYPPFCHILRLLLSGPDEAELGRISHELAERIMELTDASEEELDLLGPAPCVIRKIKGSFRVQILLKCNNIDLLQSLTVALLRRHPSRTCRLEPDLDPLMLM